VANLVKFVSRFEAGKLLSSLLFSYRRQDAVVIGLVRGGAVVAGSIARSLHLPFDILVVKKIPSPDNPELAVGAIAAGGVTFINTDIVKHLAVPEEYLTGEIRRLSKVIDEKNRLYHGSNSPTSVKNKIIIFVDDGIATGATMKAAILWGRAQHAKKIIVATPVAPPDTISDIAQDADRVVVVYKPSYFDAVGQFYKTFTQVGDKEVIELLHERY
jgi:putative phosphoribosyl transferase